MADGQNGRPSTSNKEYAYVSGGTNLYIYVSSEVVDYVFSTIRITTFMRVIPPETSLF